MTIRGYDAKSFFHCAFPPFTGCGAIIGEIGEMVQFHGPVIMDP
jgi:hypothetical protein